MNRKIYFIIFISVFLVTVVLLFLYWNQKGLSNLYDNAANLFRNLKGCNKVEIINNINGYTITADNNKVRKEIEAIRIWKGIQLDATLETATERIFSPCNTKIIFTNEVYNNFRQHNYSDGEYIGSTKVDKEEDTLLLYVGVGSDFIRRDKSVVIAALDYIPFSDLYDRTPNNWKVDQGYKRITNGNVFVVSDY